jgi:hypothetical protein
MTHHKYSDRRKPITSRVTGNTTTSYPTAHSLVWDHIGSKTMVVACSHLTNSLKYKINSYAYPGSVYPVATRTEVTLTAGSSTAFEIAPYAQVVVDCKNAVADTAGYHTSGTNPALTLVSLETAGYHAGGNDPAITLAPVKGKHVSASNPTLDLSSGSNTKFQIQVDGEAAPSEVTLTKASCTTGATTATEMQSKIQALGGAYATVTVTYTGTPTTDHYNIFSGTTGPSSNVQITAGTSLDVTPDLKIGLANGGVPTSGVTWDTKFKIAADTDGTAHEVTLVDTNCTNSGTTATEMQTQIVALGGIYTGVTVQYVGSHYVITSGTVGNNSKIRITSGATKDATDDLKIGTLGTNHDGNGYCELGIQVDASVSPSYVTVDAGNCTNGTTTAAELQSCIRLLGGVYAAVTVAYVGAPVTDTYLITSGTAGSASLVHLSDGSTNNCATLLKLGTTHGGTNTAGITTSSSFIIDYCGA